MRGGGGGGGSSRPRRDSVLARLKLTHRLPPLTAGYRHGDPAFPPSQRPAWLPAWDLRFGMANGTEPKPQQKPATLEVPCLARTSPSARRAPTGLKRPSRLARLRMEPSFAQSAVESNFEKKSDEELPPPGLSLLGPRYLAGVDPSTWERPVAVEPPPRGEGWVQWGMQWAPPGAELGKPLNRPAGNDGVSSRRSSWTSEFGHGGHSERAASAANGWLAGERSEWVEAMWRALEILDQAVRKVTFDPFSPSPGRSVKRACMVLSPPLRRCSRPLMSLV